MPEIRYVCLSDLHLGAANSVLTNLDDAGEHVAGPAPLLQGVLRGLRQLLEASGTTTPPTLVLHGDLFELALTTTEMAADTFGHFVVEAWGGPEGPLFAPEVLFVPGNHDHHLWEIARQRQYEHELHDPFRQVGAMRHVTPMSPDHLTTADVEPFIGDFARRALADDGTNECPRFRVLYPNLGLVDHDGGRAVVVTHGHYLEPMYRAMSFLHNVVTPDRPARLDVTQLEADNWAWIDFFWSTMGRSGEGQGDNANAIPVLYELFQSQDSIEAVVDRVIDDVLPKRRSLVRRAQRAAARHAGRRVAASVAQRERHHARVLSPEATTGLLNYLAGPVHGQLVDEFGSVPNRVDLVFGHTHKPFAARRHPTGFPGPVVAHNTGGWVVDAVQPEPTKGGSIALISADLEVVDLCIYRQSDEPGRSRVAVSPVSDAPHEATPLRDWLVDEIDPATEPWGSISSLAADTVSDRQRQLAQRIAAGTVAVRSEPPIGPRGW